MKVLAIDSSGLTATVAIVDEETTIASYTMNYKKTHSQTLIPMIDEIFGRTEMDINEMDAIVVAGGPGSFTGLRIGAATAKGLGLALGKPLVSVPTVDGMAYQLYGFQGVICPIMDARRGQVYTGLYTFSCEDKDFTFEVGGDCSFKRNEEVSFEVDVDFSSREKKVVSFEKASCEEVREHILEENREFSLKENKGTYSRKNKGLTFKVKKEQFATTMDELIEMLNEQGKNVVFLGDGVLVHKEKIERDLCVPYHFAPSYLNRQNAAAVGALGISYLKAQELGNFLPQQLRERLVSAANFRPEYLRVAQAERERKEFEEASQVLIRESTPEDIVSILELERENFPDPWSVSSITETLNQAHNLCLTAEDTGKVIGYLFVKVLDEAEVLAIAVKKQMHRKGIGRQLMDELVSFCLEKGVSRIILEVRESNESACKFYENLGFEKDGLRVDYYNNPREDGVLMSKKLEEV